MTNRLVTDAGGLRRRSTGPVRRDGRGLRATGTRSTCSTPRGSSPTRRARVSWRPGKYENDGAAHAGVRLPGRRGGARVSRARRRPAPAATPTATSARSLGGPEVHADGEIWVETLWDLRTPPDRRPRRRGRGQPRPRARHRRAAARAGATRPSSTCATRSCRPTSNRGFGDRDRIWAVFAARGMGRERAHDRHRRRWPRSRTSRAAGRDRDADRHGRQDGAADLAPLDDAAPLPRRLGRGGGRPPPPQVRPQAPPDAARHGLPLPALGERDVADRDRARAPGAARARPLPPGHAQAAPPPRAARATSRVGTLTRRNVTRRPASGCRSAGGSQDGRLQAEPLPGGDLGDRRGGQPLADAAAEVPHRAALTVRSRAWTTG